MVVVVVQLYRHWRKPGRLEEYLVQLAVDGTYRTVCHATTGATLGKRAVGIRVVDQRTGRPPALGRAVLRWAVSVSPSIPAMLFRMSQPDYGEQLRGLRAEVEAIRRRNKDDPDQLAREVEAFYRANSSPPFLRVAAPMLPALVGTWLVYRGLWRSPTRQGLHDVAAGTIVVSVRPGRPGR